MTQLKVELSDAMETSLIMLYGLATDARSEPTVLGDMMAAQAFDKVDYDFTRLTNRLVSTKSVAIKVAGRAKRFDTWTAEFLAAHEQATVLHLGAGLDPRVWRVDPGPGVRWYDIDLPGVVDARTQLYPKRENYRMIPSSVTDPQWLEEIPADGPVLVIAQGLTMYLRPDEGHALFRRITDRFPRGTIALDTHNWLAVYGVNKMLKQTFGAPMLHWAINDARELEHANPSLRCTESVSSLSAAAIDDIPASLVPRGSKLTAHVMELIPALRKISLYLRYEFGDRSDDQHQPH